MTITDCSDGASHSADVCNNSVRGGACFDVYVLPDGDVIAPPCLTVGVEPVLVCIARNWLGKHPKHRSVVMTLYYGAVWCSMVQYGAV